MLDYGDVSFPLHPFDPLERSVYPVYSARGYAIIYTEILASWFFLRWTAHRLQCLAFRLPSRSKATLEQS